MQLIAYCAADRTLLSDSLSYVTFLFSGKAHCGGSSTGILPLFSLGLHALLHPIMIPCFNSGRPKSLGDYFLLLHDLKEKVSLFMSKISCNHRVIHSFTIIISFY